MATIPRYTPGGGVPLRLGREGADTGGLGTALQEVATAGQQIAAQWIKQDENGAMLRAQNQFLEQEAKVRAEIEGRRGLAAKGATEEYRKRIAQTRESVKQGLGYGRTQEAFDVWAGQHETSAWPTIARYERSQDLVQAKADLDLRVTNVSLGLEKDNDLPRAIKDMQEAYALGLSAGVMLPEEAQQKQAIAIDGLRKESFKIAYQRDHKAAIKGIGAYGLNDQDVAYWQKRFEADQRAEERERRAMVAEQSASLLDNMKGLEIIAQETGDTSGLRKVGNQLAAIGNTKAAQRVLGTVRTYDAAYSTIREIQSLPLAEAANLVGGLRISTTNPQQAELDYTVRDAAHKAFADRMKRFNTDPAQVVDAMATGATPYERAKSRTRLQGAQGVLPQAGIRVLQNAERDQLAAQWKEADVRGKAALVERVGRDYQDLASDVLNEIKAPAGALFSRYVSDPYDKELLLRAATSKVDVPPGEREADFKVRAESTDVVETLEAARRMMPSDQRFAEYVDQMRDTAGNVGKILGKPRDGAKWIDARFSAVNDSNAKIVFPATLDRGAVRTALEKQRENMKAQAPDDATKRALGNAVWVNDGDGFSLLSPVSGRVFLGSLVSTDDVLTGIASTPYKVRMPVSQQGLTAAQRTPADVAAMPPMRSGRGR